MAYNPWETLAQNISNIGSVLNIPNMGIAGTIGYQDPTRIVQPSFRMQPTPAYSYEDPLVSPLGEPNAKGQYSWSGPALAPTNTGGTNNNPAPQPQGNQRPGNAPPYDPSFNGQTVNYGGGQWKGTNGQWAWEGSNEERSAAIAAAQRQEEQAINEIYNPLFSSLDEQRRNLEAQQPGQEQQIQGAYDRGIEGVTGQQSEAQMQLAKRGTASDVAQANALANARQLYSELSQRYGSMFGSRSSAGPAAQELLGRETTRRFGEIGTAREQDRQAVADETARLGTWVNTQKQEWKRKKETALIDLQNTFKNQIGQINSARNTLESQKARERSQALTDARTKQAMVDQADRDFQQKLALFQAEKQSQLTTTPAYAMNSYSSAVQGMGQYGAPQMSQTGNQGTSGYTVAGNGDYLWEIDPRTGQRVPRRMI